MIKIFGNNATQCRKAESVHTHTNCIVQPHNCSKPHLQAQLRVLLHGSFAKVAAPQHGPYSHVQKSGVAAVQLSGAAGEILRCAVLRHGARRVPRPTKPAVKPGATNIAPEYALAKPSACVLKAPPCTKYQAVRTRSQHINTVESSSVGANTGVKAITILWQHGPTSVP